MFFCVTYSSFDTLASVAVKEKAVFPSIITNAFGVNLFYNCIPLIVYFNTSVTVLFFLHLVKR